jgi:hypothetical protein
LPKCHWPTYPFVRYDAAGKELARIDKDGVRLVEVSPEKKVVWKWQANVPNVHHFRVLAVDGVAVPLPPLR